VLRASARGPKGVPIQIEPADLDLASAARAMPVTTPKLAERVARGRLSLRDALEELKRASVRRALEETAGNWAEAARRLGMDRGNLHHMAQRLGVKPA
jgi:anaerobic nitric oxide reductase transcription regulator